jgi:hypothetical protein
LRAGGTIGLGYICDDAVEASFRVADPRGIFRDVRLTSLPFYDSSKRRARLSWNALV